MCKALADYLKSGPDTEASLAARVGVSQATINRYASGQRRPRDPKTARKIERETAGAVKATELMGVGIEGEAA